MEMNRFSFSILVLIGLILFPTVSTSFGMNEETTASRLAISSMSIPRGTVDPDIIVDINDPKRTWNGTTLFSDLQKQERPRIVEVNMLGEIVWQYVLPQNLKEYTNPGFDVELLPNNNVLFVLPAKGVYEVNRKGDIVWSYLDEKVDHDADRLPNGNTLMVFGNVEETVNDPQVKEISPKGEIVWSWYARDHFYKAPFRDVYDQGWTHTNSATRLPNGNTLVSLRNFNLIVEVNPQGSVVWSCGTGVFTCQHSPKILPNDNLLVADTTWLRAGPWGPDEKRPPGGIEVNRKTEEIVWQFRPKELLHIRDADRLPNGNTLITTGQAIIEVTPEGKVAWRLRMALPPPVPVPQQFYKAERVGMVAPQFEIHSPQDRTYDSSEIGVSIKYSDVDLSTIWYRIYDRDKSRWVTGDLMYVRNRWSNAITFDGKETGIGKITLDDGNYALRVWANSTGWGDMGENIFERKLVNIAEASVNFSVSAKTSAGTASSPTRTTPETGLAPPNTIVTYGIAGLVAVAVVTAVWCRQRRRRHGGETAA